MGQTIAQAIWQEGWLKGYAEGFAQGYAEGKLISSREILRLLLMARFGPLPDGLVQRIESGSDLDRLMAAAIQVLSLKKLEDLQL